jgi:hypothetical protein
MARDTERQLTELSGQTETTEQVVFRAKMKFRRATRTTDEPVNEFVARLRELSLHCEFKNAENEILNQFYAGMQSEEFELKCQDSTEVFDLPKAIEIALSLEQAQAQVSELHEPTEAFQLDEKQSSKCPRTELEIDGSSTNESSPINIINELKHSEQIISEPQLQMCKSAVQPTIIKLKNPITNREIVKHDRDRVPKKRKRPGSHRIQSVENESPISKEPEEAEQPVQLGPVRHAQDQHEQQVDRKAKRTVSWSRKRKKDLSYENQVQRSSLQQSRMNMASVSNSMSSIDFSLNFFSCYVEKKVV